MPGLRLRVVDSFTDQPFAGNPAAVVVLEQAPPDAWMAAVAREMNLSETAFVLPELGSEADYRLRWFTPTVEVDLCGHATLAAAHCLFEDGRRDPVRFSTRSGLLTVERGLGGALAMDFPASPPVEIDVPDGLAEALGVAPAWTGLASINQLLVVIADEEAVRNLRPDFVGLTQIDVGLVIVTARADPGQPYDFVSRAFAPNFGINEDPVTGSAHTVLAPYWSVQLGRTAMTGCQVSARSGLVGVDLRAERVTLLGSATTVLEATLTSSALP